MKVVYDIKFKDHYSDKVIIVDMLLYDVNTWKLVKRYNGDIIIHYEYELREYQKTYKNFYLNRLQDQFNEFIDKIELLSLEDKENIKNDNTIIKILKSKK